MIIRITGSIIPLYAVFDGDDYEIEGTLYQFEINRKLIIKGLDLPTVTTVEFSLAEKNDGGETTVTDAVTIDGNTIANIPNQLLWTENNSDYRIFAYVNVTDSEENQIQKKIKIRVKSKRKPENMDAPENISIFQEAIKLISNLAENARKYNESAEGWAHGGINYPERDEDNAKYYSAKAKEYSEAAERSESEVVDLAENAKKEISDLSTRESESILNISGDEKNAIFNISTEQKQQISGYLDTAKNYADNAEKNASIAFGYAKSAKDYSDSADTSAFYAEKYANDAAIEAERASTEASNAYAHAISAESAEANAKVALNGAEAAKEKAESAQSGAESAKSDTENAKTEAENIVNGFDTHAEQKKQEITDEGERVKNSIPEDYQKMEEDVSRLSESITKINDDLSQFTDTWYPHKYINVNGITFKNKGYYDANGNLQDEGGANWRISDPIKVDKGAKVTCKIYAMNGVVSSISAWDEDGNFIKDASSTVSPLTSYEVPEGVSFIRFCKQTSYQDNFFTILEGAYIKGLSTHILDIDESLKEHEKDIKGALKRRNIIAIGDSYGIQNTNGDITKFYWEYLRNALNLTEGVNFFHKYRIGAGMGNGGYLEQIQLLDDYVADKDSITDILLCGGWNDSNTQNVGGTDAEFWSGAETFFIYIKEKYPNSMVTIAHISWGRFGSEGMRDQLNLSLNRYKEMANKYGCRFLTNMEYVLHVYPSEYWQSDNAHPNNKGHELLGHHIVSAFLSGSADVLYDSDISDLVTWGQALETIGKVYSEVNNNVTKVWSASENGLITINGFTNNGINPSGATEYGIAKITAKHFRGYRHHTFATTGCIILANGKYYHGSVRLRFDGDMVYARFYVPHDGLNTWLGNLTNIYIQDFDLSVATMKS